MVFVDKIERAEAIVIDGYSKAKTVKGAISDIGRYVKKHINKNEGDMMIEYAEDALLMAEDSDGGYFLEVDAVGCASREGKNGEMEYKDSNFYIVCRIVK